MSLTSNPVIIVASNIQRRHRHRDQNRQSSMRHDEMLDNWFCVQLNVPTNEKSSLWEQWGDNSANISVLIQAISDVKENFSTFL